MNKLELLKALEFTDYEARVISSLNKIGKATPKEINQDSGVPQNKIYGILRSLENNGLIAHIPSNQKKYQLINLKSYLNNKVIEKQKEIINLKEASKNIETIKEQEKEFVFSLIKGQIPTMNKLAEYNQKVKKEILGVQRNWKIWGEGLRAMKRATSRGVSVKIIGLINNNTEKKAEEWKKVGCKIKAYNDRFGDYPLRFSIFDNNIARITIGKPEIPNPKDYITIWTDSKPLIAMLRNQFFEMWKECKNF